LLKRSFKKNWTKPKREGVVIYYNETNIVDVFNRVKNAKIVYGAEGGIYHLCVYFNKPFVMIVPDRIINSDKEIQDAAYVEHYYRHPTYKHRYMSESLFNEFAY